MIDGFTRGEIPDEARSELLGHFSDNDPRFGTALVRRHGLGSDIVVNVQWHEHGDEGPGYVVKHTVVFLHRPGAVLPEFEIRPRKGVAEKALGMLVSLLGAPPMELEDEPVFNERYSVMTANPDSVRVLLGRQAVESILAVDDLHLRFGGRGVLASRRSIDGSSGGRSGLAMRDIRDHRLEGGAIKALVEDTIIAGGPIVDDPEVGRRAADAVEGSYAEEAARHLQEQGGFIGRQVALNLITGEMLDRMKSAPAPRTEIPAPVARRAWGSTTIPMIVAPIFGLIFITIGIVTILGGSSEGMGFVGFGLAALVVMAFVLRFRSIRRKLVIRGVPVDARVGSVDRTNTSVNDDPIHKITIVTQDGSEPMVVKMGSAPARQARRMMEAGKATWILRDPDKPSRGLWLDGWCLDNSVD